MANEVIIEEYTVATVKTPDGNIAQIPGELVTSQIIDLAVLSAQFNARTSFVRIQSKGLGFWYIFGAADASAVANADGNRWLPADQFRDLPVSQASRYLDTVG